VRGIAMGVIAAQPAMPTPVMTEKHYPRASVRHGADLRFWC